MLTREMVVKIANNVDEYFLSEGFEDDVSVLKELLEHGIVSLAHTQDERDGELFDVDVFLIIRNKYFAILKRLSVTDEALCDAEKNKIIYKEEEVIKFDSYEQLEMTTRYLDFDGLVSFDEIDEEEFIERYKEGVVYGN